MKIEEHNNFDLEKMEDFLHNILALIYSLSALLDS